MKSEKRAVPATDHEKHPVHDYRALAAKYLEGGTSLDEERLLREFFAAGSTLAGFEELPAMFGFFAAEAARTAPAGLGMEHGEGVADRIARPKRTPHPKITWVRAAAAVAACIAVACLYVFLPHAGQPASCAYVDGRKVTDPAGVMAEYANVIARVNHDGILDKAGRALEKMSVLDKVQRPLDKLAEIDFEQLQ